MSIYRNQLKDLIEKHYTGMTASEIIDPLFRLGVIDNTLVKVLLIREYVGEQVRNGVAKLHAMWEATETFACTYEYVRKCVYYYKDIEIEKTPDSKSV